MKMGGLEEVPTPAPLHSIKWINFLYQTKERSYRAPAACFSLTQIFKEMPSVCLFFSQVPEWVMDEIQE